jgi:hypothetical protein
MSCVLEYNEIAKEVAAEVGARVVDLYGYVEQFCSQGTPNGDGGGERAFLPPIGWSPCLSRGLPAADAWERRCSCLHAACLHTWHRSDRQTGLRRRQPQSFVGMPQPFPSVETLLSVGADRPESGPVWVMKP